MDSYAVSFSTPHAQSQRMESPANQCLRSALHLVCVRGVDRGCVVPVKVGVVVGRGDGVLQDPYLSRRHATFAPERAGSGWLQLQNLSSTNPARTGELRKRLGTGQYLTLGSGRWLVRARPTSSEWVQLKSKPAGIFRMGRFLLPIMLIAMVARLTRSVAVLAALGVLASLGTAAYLLWRRKYWKQWDEGRLLLTAAAQRDTPNATGTHRDSEVPVLRVPGQRGLVLVPTEPGTVVAVVGSNARDYAHWVAGQLFVLGLPVHLSKADALSKTDTRSTQSNDVLVVWSNQVDDVPPETAMVLVAESVGSASWCKQLDQELFSASQVPDYCSYADVLADWDKEAHPDSRAVPLGMSAEGPLGLDLVELGPHALVVGGTGSGKSEFLTTFAIAHALRFAPAELRIVLLDFKGGAGLDHLEALPHVEHSLSDLDGSQVPWLLRALGATLQQRKRSLREAGCRAWHEWEMAPPRLLLLVDEFHVLAQTHPDLMEELVSIASQGRSLGIHLVLATQRPSGAINAQMKATLDLRIALHCREKSDSVEAIGTDAATHLPRVPGRALVNRTQIQTAHIEVAPPWIERVISKWEAESASDQLQRSGWSAQKVVPDPLPEILPRIGGRRWTPDSLGVFETPGQANQPLHDPGGSVAIIGPPSTKAELTALAQTVVQSRATSKPVGPTIWVSSADPLGMAARTLVTLIHEENPPKRTVVIDGVTELFSRLEAIGRPDQVRNLWEGLLGCCQRRELVLIATDTKARYNLSSLPLRLLRIPDTRSLLTADIAVYFPTSMAGDMGLPIGNARDLGRYASPNPRRVLASGFSQEGCVWAQVAQPGNQFAADQPGRGTPRVEQPVAPLFNPTRAEVTVWVIGPPHAVTDLLPSDRGSSNGRIKTLTPDQWPLLAAHMSEPIIAVEPGAEVVRLFSQRYPEDAIWITASSPFRSGESLASTGTNVTYLADVYAAHNWLEHWNRTL